MSPMNTQLNDRVLWYDGVSQVHPDHLITAMLGAFSFDGFSVTELSQEVERYNRLVTDQPISVKTGCAELDVSYSLPKRYAELDFTRYIEDEIIPRVPADELYADRMSRLVAEITFIEKHDMVNLIRTLVYVRDTLNEKRVVWGIGRGSSCASYLLYLMEIHYVDPVAYDIPMDEFFR